MLTVAEQKAEYDRVVAMCKGTEYEGREPLCVKFRLPSATEYRRYEDIRMVDLDDGIDRIFAIALVKESEESDKLVPIWLEEPFKVIHREVGVAFVYNKQTNKLESKRINRGEEIITIPISMVFWDNFYLVADNPVTQLKQDIENCRKLCNETNDTMRKPLSTNQKQVGGNHYKSKAIQPWDYMQANYPREQFIGFLRGNIQRYIDRYRDKNGIEDLQKAMHYLEKLIEVESEERS